MAVKEISRTGIKMTKKNRLAIVTRAREIITDPKRWTKGRLRRRTGGEYRYCLLGACEQAAYELGLAESGKHPFKEPKSVHETSFGYEIGKDLSISEFSAETRGLPAYSVNDAYGHRGALKLLDDYIKELKKSSAK